MLLFIAFFAGLADAAPTTNKNSELQRRDDTNANLSLKPQVWVPILIVGVLVLGLAYLAISKNRLARWSLSGQAAAAAGTGTVSASSGGAQVREITAAQLTNGNNSNSGATPATRTTRRTRRPRRTPSQISTTSLPAYAKEPGEQELVIFSGPADMEDVQITSVTAAVDMPTVEEDGDLDSDISHRDRYTPTPNSPQDMPLLENDEGTGQEHHGLSSLAPPGSQDLGRRSVETVNLPSDDGSFMTRVDTNTDEDIAERGAAPAYFEVVDPNDVPARRHSVRNNNASTATATPNDEPVDSSEPVSPSRRSTFRFSNIFARNGSHRASQSGPPMPPLPPGIPLSSSNTTGHTRGESAGALSLTSIVSRSTQASPPNRSRSRMGTNHGPSPSSSSLLSLVNPLRRKKSTATLNSVNLTSPSVISLQSISAPLSHTVVKTEFTYPKTGPTPEQLKLISSRESMARFGVPFGAEAVKWAKSQTDLNDMLPPPEFEEIMNGGASSSSSSGTSSNTEGSSSTSATSEASANASLTVDLPNIVVDAASKPSSPAPSIAELPEASSLPSTSTSSHSPSHQIDPSSFALPDSPPTSPVSTLNAASRSKALPSTALIDPTSIPIPESAPVTPVSTINNIRSKFLPSPTESPSLPPTIPSKAFETPTPNTSTSSKGPPPPSSFRADPIPYSYARAESRASSFRSFATANESLGEFGERTPGPGVEASRSGSVASRYYSDYDTEDDDGESIRGGQGQRYQFDSVDDSGDETEVEEDERRERRMTVRPTAA